MTVRPIRLPAAAAALALALSGITLPAAADAPAEGGWTATRLDLTVTVDPTAGRVRLDGTMRLRLDLAASPGPAIGINAGNDIMRFVDVRGPAGSTATLGKGFGEAENVRTAAVRLAAPAERGAEVEVAFSCESEGKHFQFAVSEQAALASWTVGWYPYPLPVPGHELTPAVGRIPGTTRFVLPKGWRSVSNGKPSGDAAELWEVDAPVLRSFAAGPYESSTHAAGARTVGVYILSKKPVPPERHAELVARALAAQEARFGPYPYPSYIVAEVPDDLVDWYASSEQGFIMAVTPAFELEDGNLVLWAHEMAHGWWGNLVNTKGPGSQWVSESLAQYGAVVAIEAAEGQAAAAEFLEYSRKGYNPLQCALGYFAMARDGNDMPLAALTGKNKWEHNLSDAKGHWVYHMLRHRVGDEVFFATLKSLVRDFAGRQLSVADARAAFTRAAPEAGLDRFFAQWLDRAGAPVLDVDWYSVDKGTAVAITIEQRQPGEPYALPIEVAIDLKGGQTRVETLQVTKPRETFTVATAARPLAVRLDPNRRALIWRPEYGPAPAPK
jgi:hypothetical protein